jgi:hypothetical protein
MTDPKLENGFANRKLCIARDLHPNFRAVAPVWSAPAEQRLEELGKG